MTAEPQTPPRFCPKCWAQLPAEATKRQRYCSKRCATAARVQRHRKASKAGRSNEYDKVLATANSLSAEVVSLRKRVAAVHRIELERDRHRYRADTAVENADKKIRLQAEALTELRTELETMSGQYRTVLAALSAANEEVANLLTAAAQPGHGGRGGHRQPVKQEPALTMATQIYKVFYALLGRYKRDRAGVPLEDYDYMLYEHGHDFAGRKKMNTTELDTRTLYYFARMTKIAVSKAEDTNFQDHQTKNAIRLYNEVVKYAKIPTNIPTRLQRVELPAQGLDKVRL